jgi:hypothetical protein
VDGINGLNALGLRTEDISTLAHAVEAPNCQRWRAGSWGSGMGLLCAVGRRRRRRNLESAGSRWPPVCHQSNSRASRTLEIAAGVPRKGQSAGFPRSVTPVSEK